MAIVCVILRVYFSFVNESACGSLWKTVLWFSKESGGRVLGVHGSGSFHGPFPILGRAREKTTAQEAPGTTIDRRYDPGYPLLARPQPRGRRPDIRWLRIQAPPISRE